MGYSSWGCAAAAGGRVCGFWGAHSPWSPQSPSHSKSCCLHGKQAETRRPAGLLQGRLWGHCSTSQPPPQRPLLRGASPAFLGASQEVDPRDFDASRVTLGVVTCHCAEAWIGGVAPGGWADGVSTGRRESPASAGQHHLPEPPLVRSAALSWRNGPLPGSRSMQLTHGQLSHYPGTQLATRV